MTFNQFQPEYNKIQINQIIKKKSYIQSAETHKLVFFLLIFLSFHPCSKLNFKFPIEYNWTKRKSILSLNMIFNQFQLK